MDVVLSKAYEQIQISGKGQHEVTLLPVHFLGIARTAVSSVITDPGPPGILGGIS